MKRRMKLLTMLLAGTVAFGTAQAPLTAMAATSGSYSITQPGTVNATKNVAYKISGVTKKQYAVVRVRGAAKSAVTVTKGTKNITSAATSSGYRISGTGKTQTVKVKAKKTAVNKKYKVVVRIYNSASKKLVKKVSAISKVLVAATSVSLDSTTLSLKEGESTTLSYTLKPATSTDSVTYTSTNKSVASVDANGKVTAVAAGSATITATTTSGKTAICTVNVAAEQTPDEPSKPDDPNQPDNPDEPTIVVGEAASITGQISNALADYADTVLSTTNAELSVKVTDKDGNAIANKNVILTLDTNTPANAVQIQGEAADATTRMITTDDKGIATFVLRNKNEDAVAAASYTVKAVGTEVETKGVVKFATLSIGTVQLASPSTLETGTNAKSTWGSSVGGSRSQAALSGKEGVYVASQQVSTAGTNEHAVTLKAEAKITIPGAKVETDNTDSYVQTVPAEQGTLGAYSIYTGEEKIIELEKDTRDIKTATVTFKSINLSKYTKLTVTYYKTGPTGQKVKVGDETVEGEATFTDRGVQIPIQDNQDISAVGIKVESAGQVDTDKALGYVVDSIRYTYADPDNAAGGQTETLKGATITWENDAVVYEIEKKLDPAGDVSKLNALGFGDALPNGSIDTDHTYTYTVPSYPSTGNAIITEKDAKGDIVAYYLAPTSNEVVSDGAGGYKWNNKNVLTALNTNYSQLSASLDTKESYAYKASAEEIQALTGNYSLSVSNGGQTIVVNSAKSGMVNLKGTISIDGVGEKELTGLNRNLYTSVQFNPVPSQSAPVNNVSETFLALVGQDVNVTAQLVDKNGNKVSTSGKMIAFGYQRPTGDAAVTSAAGFYGTTDPNGQFKASFTANQKSEVTNLMAGVYEKDASGTVTLDGENYKLDESYMVQLTIGNRNVQKANIDWLGANLNFVDTVVGAAFEVTTENDMKTVKDSGGNYYINPTVGSHWKYGVRTVADRVTINGKTYEVSIDGLKVNMTSATGNKGTYAATDVNGEMTATSVTSNIDRVVATLDSSSTGGELKFIGKEVKYDSQSSSYVLVEDGEAFEYAGVGTGAANLAAEIDLYVKWGETDAKVLQAVTPSIVKGNRTQGKTIYVRVTDSTGQNPEDAADVTATVNNGSVTVTDGDATSDKTNKDGYAKIQVTAPQGEGAANATIVSVKYDNQVQKITVNWNDNTALGLETEDETPLVEITGSNTIELTFNNNIDQTYFNEKMFEVTEGSFTPSGEGEESAATGTYGETKALWIDHVSADGNKVTITLKDTISKETGKALQIKVKDDTTTIKGMALSLTDEYGCIIPEENRTLVTLLTMSGDVVTISPAAPGEPGDPQDPAGDDGDQE